MSFGGLDEQELKLLQLAAEDAPLTAGRLLSSQALIRLYTHLLKGNEAVAGEDAHEAFASSLSKQDAVAVEATQLLSRWIGRHAADVALVTGAEGGAYLFSDSGRHGLAPLSREALRDGFDFGQSGSAAATIPLFLVDSTTAALKGAVIAMDFDEDHGAKQPVA